MSGHQREDGFLSDFCDGSNFKSHPLLSSDTNNPALEIMLYYDDVEVCNPLGSRAKKHKLGLFVFCLFCFLINREINCDIGMVDFF